jgi:hypothetical protein
MIVLRIEHPVPDFERWKEMFDSDPLDRAQSGVRRYMVSRPVGDPNHVLIDLEFDQLPEAEAMLGRLQELWSGTDVVTQDPKTTLIEVVDAGQP